jgi:fatty-acyl-CoA synthase
MTAVAGGVGSWIERRALIAPDHAALVFGETTCTYGELADRVRRVATGLRQLGVGRGDRVVWLGPNHPAFLEVFFATAKLGAVLAPVNHRLAGSMIEQLVAEYSAEVAVLGEGAGEAVLPGVRSRVVVGAPAGAEIGYEELIADSAGVPVEVEVTFDELCLLAHTSGTTGMPKGVMLTHGNVTWNVVNLLSLVDFRGDDVTIAIAPFFRTGGTGVNVLPVLFKGGTVVIPETLEPNEVLGLLEQRRVTVGFGNPDLLGALVRSREWQTTDLGRIRCFITGGAPVPERLLRTYTERGVPLFQGYGLSEAGPFVLLLDAPNALRKLGSAGKPPLFVDVRTARRDGSPCAANETGELLARGPNVMVGYWNDEAATRTALDREGWLHTGDAARIDDEGYTWIVDRVVDAYESAGQVVYPGDVERVLGEHPSVDEVGIAARDGVSIAFVVPTTGTATDEHELVEFCQRHLQRHQVPTSVIFVNSLPRNSVGKLLRHELGA